MRRRGLIGTVLAASLALSLGGAAVAQGGGGGGGRGGGMMLMRGGGAGGLGLLRMPEVQRELNMTPAQIGKIEEKQREVREAMQAMFPGGGGGFGQLSTEERRALTTRMQEAQTKAVNAILDATQQKRFRQLELQQQGPLAIATRNDVATDLKLTDEQKKQVAEVYRQSQDEMRSALQGANFQSMSPEERGQMMARMRQMQTSAGDKVTAALTDAQKTQWKEMLGAPFTFPVPPGGAPRPATGGAAAPSEQPRPGAANNGEQAEIGKPVRDFRLRDLTDKNKETYHTLSQYRGKKAVVAVFLSNRCGTTWQYEERMGKLMQDMVGKDVVVLGIHSNVNESQDEIRKYVETRNFAAPVLDDKEKNEFVTYFDARVTPTVLVIDKEGVLRYKGSYDDNADAKMVKTRYAEDALNAVLTGKAVPVTTTRAFG